VVTKPFHFEGARRMRLAEGGIEELQKSVDTLIVIPNQNLFRVANEKTTFADAFAMADQVLYSGVACITDLMVKEGLINLDFADVRSIMSEMGKAMMGTGEASGDRRAVMAAEAAIANPLLDETSMKGARGLLISITGGADLTLYEVDEAASRIRQEVDEEANIILGATFDAALEGVVRVSVVATGIDQASIEKIEPVAPTARIEAASRLRPAASRATPTPIAAETYAEMEPEFPPPIPAAEQDEVEVRPAAPKPMAYVEPVATRPEEPIEREFIPPAPEQPTVRPPRMPQIEELPLVAQNQLRAHRGEAPPAAPPAETRRRSLLEKLAAFGISRHEEEPPAPAPRAIAPALPAAIPPKPNAASVHAEYGRPQPRPAAPRPAQGNLDAHGRVASRAAQMEDDQLEIPAFLRRQSN
jgi:cell division protein FtsZ